MAEGGNVCRWAYGRRLGLQTCVVCGTPENGRIDKRVTALVERAKIFKHSLTKMMQPVSMIEKRMQDWAGEDSPGYHPYFTKSGFFQFVCQAEDTKNLKYQCMLCLPKFHTISTSKVSSSNLRKHLNRVHNLNLKDLETGARAWRKHSGREVALPEEPLTQVAIATRPETGVANLCVIPQEVFDERVAAFVTDCLLPPSIVQEESFIDFINTLQPTVQCPSEGVIVQHMEDYFAQMKASIIDRLSSVDHVCVTSNLWSSMCSYHLEVNIHWLNPDTLSRQSAVLACRKISGAPTYNLVAKEMNDVFNEYVIQGKITKLVTDDWSYAEDNFGMLLDGSEDPGSKQDGVNVTGVDLAAILSTYGDGGRVDGALSDISNKRYTIPLHHRCAARSLNLVVTKDVDASLSEGDFKKVRRAVFAKLKSVWKKTNKENSSVPNGTVKEEAEHRLVRPNSKSWQSTFHAIDHLCNVIKANPQSFHDLCRRQQVPPFSNVEVTFIFEYCDVLRPVVIALELFKSTDGCCIGYIIPTIRQLLETFDKLIGGGEDTTPVETCKPLVEALRNGTRERFKSFMNDEECLVAAVLVPRFKLLWANANEVSRLKETLKRVLREQVMTGSDALSLSLLISNPSSGFVPENTTGPSFFSFEAKRRKSSNRDPIDWCVENYLESDCNSLGVYQNTNLLKSLYCRYNTALSSPSYVGDRCFEPKRCRIDDKHFEMQLMLRQNRKLCK